MERRQYTASVFVIDFEKKEILLTYNKKIKKWIQPGGHIEGLETPNETAKRETMEETGIDIDIIGPTFDGINYEPIGIKRYINTVGDMIDIQYLAKPLTKIINSSENNEVRWVNIDELVKESNIDLEIKVKTQTLYKQYKDNN